MKGYWIFLLTVGVMTLGASGQTGASGSASGNASASTGKSGAQANANANAGANASANNSAARLSSGTTMQTELSRSLDAKKVKAGDEVAAKVTQDVKSDGKVVVPKGSKLMGHVTEASARGNGSSESRLGIAFDRAVLKNGQEVALGAVVQALAPPVEVAGSAMTQETAGMTRSAPANGGARSASNGGGGVLGGVVGGTTSAVGGTVGAVNNTAGSVAGSTTAAVGGTVNSATGLAANGALTNTSSGVFGLQGLNLSSATSGSAQASVISSTTQNVKLDSGTQMLLQVQR